MADLIFENVQDGENVYQRAVLIKGKYNNPADQNATCDGKVLVSTWNTGGSETFPIQCWPLADGRFTAFAMLSPGPNKLNFRRRSDSGDSGDNVEEHGLTIHYTPLLQQPPLHLAIMVAKDSPLQIDCPPTKHASHSTAHSSLHAATAKFRMTAYMWQALTAEDMRMHGLGRRSFRLDEEWGADTTSQEFVRSLDANALFDSGAMRGTAKVHLVRSDKTVKEIRDPDVGELNKVALRNRHLYDSFEQALLAHGGPFAWSARPVVAGLVLDSTYSVQTKMVLGHAPISCNRGLYFSFGAFGSHLTYSWPRFVEEITPCLLDAREPGETVSGHDSECGSLGEVCSFSQGAFLYQVSRAFGATEYTGTLVRDSPRHWPANFVAQTASRTRSMDEGSAEFNREAAYRPWWHLRDAVSFRMLPHFRQPEDVDVPQPVAKAEPIVGPITIFGEDDGEFQVSCLAGICRVWFNGNPEPTPTPSSPANVITFATKDLRHIFGDEGPLALEVLGMNGRKKKVRDVWRLRQNHKEVFSRFRTSDVVLSKTSVCAPSATGLHPGLHTTWGVLLTRRDDKGEHEQATSIDVRTGSVLDGAVIHFPKGLRANCGARDARFGGHASEEIHIPPGVEVVKVEVSWDEHVLHGLRIHLSNGNSGGALSGSEEVVYESCTLEPTNGERIVGFLGQTYYGEGRSGMFEFGILTIPMSEELPYEIWYSQELENYAE